MEEIFYSLYSKWLGQEFFIFSSLKKGPLCVWRNEVWLRVVFSKNKLDKHWIKYIYVFPTASGQQSWLINHFSLSTSSHGSELCAVHLVGGCAASAGLAGRWGWWMDKAQSRNRQDVQQAIHFISACATGAGQEEKPVIRGANTNISARTWNPRWKHY